MYILQQPRANVVICDPFGKLVQVNNQTLCSLIIVCGNISLNSV